VSRRRAPGYREFDRVAARRASLWKQKGDPLRNERVLFLRKFLQTPVQIGSVVPSSESLARMITDAIGLEQARSVAELGPGTGAFTGTIVQRIAPHVKLLAVEVDPVFAAAVQARFPQIRVVNGPAENLVDYLSGAAGSLDCIVSGLPWALFPAAQQERILGAILASLRPGGWFATFGYVHAAWAPAGRRFKRLLMTRFSAVERTPVVWGNFPPAFVYRCRR